VAEALVTNFFCRFGVPRELHSEPGPKLRVSSDTGGFATSGSEQNAHRTTAPVVGGTLYLNGGGAPMKIRSIAPEGLGRKIKHLPPGL
jgi:hypothetical protein